MFWIECWLFTILKSNIGSNQIIIRLCCENWKDICHCIPTLFAFSFNVIMILILVATFKSQGWSNLQHCRAHKYFKSWAIHTVAEKGHSILPITAFPILSFPILSLPIWIFPIWTVLLHLMHSHSQTDNRAFYTAIWSGNETSLHCFKHACWWQWKDVSLS